MKIKGDFLDKGRAVKRPAYVRKPLYRKGEEVTYLVYGYGRISGIVIDVYFLNSERKIYYDVNFPEQKLTLPCIPQSRLAKHKLYIPP